VRYRCSPIPAESRTVPTLGAHEFPAAFSTEFLSSAPEYSNVFCTALVRYQTRGAAQKVVVVPYVSSSNTWNRRHGLEPYLVIRADVDLASFML
jgi:hypothetical protein